jgi:hypothetical protein
LRNPQVRTGRLPIRAPIEAFPSLSTISKKEFNIEFNKYN